MHYIWEIVIYAIYRVYAPVPCNNQCYEGRSLCVYARVHLCVHMCACVYMRVRVRKRVRADPPA